MIVWKRFELCSKWTWFIFSFVSIEFNRISMICGNEWKKQKILSTNFNKKIEFDEKVFSSSKFSFHFDLSDSQRRKIQIGYRSRNLSTRGKTSTKAESIRWTKKTNISFHFQLPIIDLSAVASSNPFFLSFGL